jgi:hypothetical protein
VVSSSFIRFAPFSTVLTPLLAFSSSLAPLSPLPTTTGQPYDTYDNAVTCSFTDASNSEYFLLFSFNPAAATERFTYSLEATAECSLICGSDLGSAVLIAHFASAVVSISVNTTKTQYNGVKTEQQ